MTHEFATDVLGQAKGQQPTHGQRILRRPRGGGDPEQLQFERTAPALQPGHRGIHAFGVAGQRRARRTTEPHELGVGGRADPQGEHAPIYGEGRLAEGFGQTPRAGPPVELHLPQAIARMQRAGGEPRIVGIAGVDVRHAVDVGDDLHRSVQTRQRPLGVQ